MRSAVLLPTLLAITTSHAQDEGFRCLANNPVELERHLRSDPGAEADAQQAKAILDAQTIAFNRGGGESYVIPVVFHVIHNHGQENIADEQLYDAIRVLNEDYNKQNPDTGLVRPEFQGIIGDVGIEFRLARRDPEGNCTNGITRTVSTRTYDGDFEMTQLIQWPRDRYMNVWVAASANGAAGYTYYPMWLDGWPEADGIVILHDYTGSIGTSSPYRSRVLSHEVGHWLNLKHCWGDSNEPGLESNCDMDDEVDDTPLTIGWTACALAGSSCGNTIDNVQNYMEYSYCCRMFSQGQGDRMITALTSAVAQRNNLWQPPNLALTGVYEQDQLCLARFDADNREVCAGSQVQFEDLSYFGVTDRFWSLPGAEPSASFEASPMVTYATPGIYPVTLNVGDGTNTLSSTADAFIRVLPNPGLPVPWSEGFESAQSLPNETWRIENPDGDVGFELTSSAAFTGSNCVRIMNGPEQDGRRDELISTAFDMSQVTEIVLSFRYAYARRAPENDDVLYVYVSGDCGETWVLRKVMRSITTLVTAPPNSVSFFPSSPDDWGYAELTNIGPSLETSSFRVRFVFESDGGNTLYLDDINLNGLPVGLAEMGGSYPRATLFPNPVNGPFHVRADLPDGWAAYVLTDALGRSVRTGSTFFVRGITTIGRLEAAPGSYLLTLSVEDQVRSVRFMLH